MSLTVKETQGDTLIGAIDGANAAYTTSFDFEDGTVNVYVNGRLKIKEWDDGFNTIPPRIVVLKEPLLVGDSLEIEYRADTKTGGGALGGVPPAPQLSAVVPDNLRTDQNLPTAVTDSLEPQVSGHGPNQPRTVPAELRPVIITPEEC